MLDFRPASLGLAAVAVDDGDPGEDVPVVRVLALVLGRHLGGLAELRMRFCIRKIEFHPGGKLSVSPGSAE